MDDSAIGQRSQSSASAEQFMSRSASALGSWGDQSVRSAELNQKLVSALQKNRERIPEEWFEKHYANFAKRDAAVRQQTEERLEARRRRCEDFAVSRRRALDRVYSDIRPREQQEREERRRSLEHRMAESHARLAKEAEEKQAAIMEQKKRHQEDSVERREFFADVRREQEERAAAFQRLADERPKAARQAVERRLSAVAERSQRRQALQLEALKHRDHVRQQQYEQSQTLMDRQRGLSEWLKSLDEQKQHMLWQRRVDGVRSSLQRQAILETSYDAWHQGLRSTPLPNDPKELHEIAVRMTSK